MKEEEILISKSLSAKINYYFLHFKTISKEYKQCQSCGMPLVKKCVSMKGLEQGGSESQLYCSICYENGKFKDELSLVEMKKIVDDALKENSWILPLRFMSKMQLPSLAR